MVYTQEFETFWQAYPRRLGPNPKGLAWKAWLKALKQTTAADLTRAATAFAAECAKLKTDPAFVPHTRTWLTQERWTDYLSPTPENPPPDGEPMPELFQRLRLRRPGLTPAVWKSWLAPLQFDQGADGTVITAPTRFVRNHCETHWGRDLAALLGPIRWRVAK